MEKELMNQIKGKREKLTYMNPDDPLLRKAVIGLIELTTGQKKLQRVYDEIMEDSTEPVKVWGTALEKLNIDVQYSPEQLEKVPGEGPVIFVANHPFGVVDGLIFGHLVSRVRPEFFFLVNEVLIGEVLLKDHLLPVDFRTTKEAMRTNILTKQQTIQRLKAGEALAIFPSGGVATAPRVWKRAEDLEWKRFVAKVMQQTQATVIPLFFHGQNSRLFQLASKLSMSLRLSLLLFEIKNKIGKRIHVTIGDPIDYSEVAGIKDRQRLLEYIREKTMQLEKSKAVGHKLKKSPLRKRGVRYHP
jgi:putative hemolysin